MTKILILATALIFSGCSYSDHSESESLGATFTMTSQFKKDFEPSGVALCNNVIYVVSDEGTVAYGQRDSWNYFQIDDKDFEGVSCNDKNLFIVEEGKDNILEFTFDGTLVKKYNIDRNFNGEKVINKKGDGLESLTFYKEDDRYLYFITANQSDDFIGDDKSAVIFIKADKHSGNSVIEKYFPVQIKDISGMFYNDGIIYFISDTTDTLYLADENMNIFKEFKITGEAQEGISIDFKNTKVYIADDEGSLLILELSKDAIKNLNF